MARKKVIREETLTGDDAIEESNLEKEVKKKDTKDEIDKYVKGFAKKELENITVRVRRLYPVMFKGKRIGGLLGEFSPPFEPMVIKENFGGGRYQIDFFKDGAIAKSFFEDIAGDPIIDVSEEHPSAVKTKTSVDPSEILEQQIEDSAKELKMRKTMRQLKEMQQEEANINASMQPPVEETPQVSQDDFTKEVAVRAARMVLHKVKEEANNNQMTGFAQMLTALVPLLKPAQPPIGIAEIIALMNVNKKDAPFQPKDIMGIMTPMMAEFMRGQSELRKYEMQNMNTIQAAVMEKMLDNLKSAGAETDEIDKIRKWLPLISDAFAGLKQVLPPRRIPVPQQRRIAPPAAQPKPQPQPQVKTETQPKQEPDQPPVEQPAEPEQQPEPEPEQNPAVSSELANLDPKKIASFRVNSFLVAVEKEMQLGADPDTIYDENFEQAFYLLPKELREIILSSDNQMTIVDGFNKFGDIGIVSKIIKMATENKDASKWLADLILVIRQAHIERNEPEETSGEGANL